MSKYSRYKVNCSELPELMGREAGNLPPTENQVEEFFRIMEKELRDITELQKIKIQQFVTRTVEYDATALSTTMRKILHKYYAYTQYGASKISNGGDPIVQLEKGEIAESDAIKLLSKLDGANYEKNEKLYSNKWFKGRPDIVLIENGKIVGVKDVKVPLDLPNFIEKVDFDASKDDRWEMMAYLDVLGLNEGEICYCLVNMPDEMKNARIEEYKKKLKTLGVSSQSVAKKLKQLELSMTYDYIPEEQRVKRFIVRKKNYFTRQAHDRVKIVRKKLNEIHEKFQNSNVILIENIEKSQNDIS